MGSLGAVGLVLYLGTVVYPTVTMGEGVDPAKMSRFRWRVAIALTYCTITVALKLSSALHSCTDRFMNAYFRSGVGARIQQWLMVLYNCVQIYYCLRCTYECCSAYVAYHGVGLYGWLGLSMTRWDWTEHFLTTYSNLKVLDLCDTLWIVMRGSWGHLSVLHISHHTTMVLPYEVWLAFYDTKAPILYTLIPFMNSLVHALLYIYYTVVLGKHSSFGPLRALANFLFVNRGLLTCVQFTQFPTAVVVSVVAAMDVDGYLPASVCYGLVGAMNATLFAPLLPFFKKKNKSSHNKDGEKKGL